MPSPEHFRALFDPRGVIVAGASTHPGKFGFVALHNILANGYAGEVFATNREGGEVLGRPTFGSIDDDPRRRGRPRLRVHTGRRQPRGAAPGGRPGRAGGFHRVGRLRRVGGGGTRPPGRAGGAGRRPRHARGRPQRAGPGVHPVVAVRPDRGALPAEGPHRCGQPVGQLRVVVPEPLPAVGCRCEPGRVGRQRRPGRRARRPRVLRRRPRDQGRPGVRRGPARRATVLRAALRGHRPPAGRGAEGRGVVHRRPGRGQPHRLARPPTTRSSTACAARPVPCAPPPCSRRSTWPPRWPPSPYLRDPRWPSSRPSAAGVSSPPTPWRAHRSSCSPLPDDLRDSLDELLPPRWSRNNPIDLAGGETKDTVPDGDGGRGLPSRGRRRDHVRASGSRPTRAASSRRDRSSPSTASSASSASTTARTGATSPSPPSCPSSTPSRCWWPPSWPSPTPTTPPSPRCARPVATASRRPIGPSWPSTRPGATSDGVSDAASGRWARPAHETPALGAAGHRHGRCRSRHRSSQVGARRCSRGSAGPRAVDPGALGPSPPRGAAGRRGRPEAGGHPRSVPRQGRRRAVRGRSRPVVASPTPTTPMRPWSRPRCSSSSPARPH